MYKDGLIIQTSYQLSTFDKNIRFILGFSWTTKSIVNWFMMICIFKGNKDLEDVV